MLFHFPYLILGHDSSVIVR